MWDDISKIAILQLGDAGLLKPFPVSLDWLVYSASLQASKNAPVTVTFALVWSYVDPQGYTSGI